MLKLTRMPVRVAGGRKTEGRNGRRAERSKGAREQGSKGKMKLFKFNDDSCPRVGT